MVILDKKPMLRIVPDMFNNVNRLCTTRRTDIARVWRITAAMRNVRNGGYDRWYSVEHIVTGERDIVPVECMSNMY